MIRSYSMPFYKKFSSDDEKPWAITHQEGTPIWMKIAIGVSIVLVIVLRLTPYLR